MTQFHSRKTPRAQRYDYTSSGMYFVTVCTKDREHYFGEIRRDVLVGHPQIILSDIGEMCNHEIKQLNQKKTVDVHEWVVMPNHVHILLGMGGFAQNMNEGYRRDDLAGRPENEMSCPENEMGRLDNNDRIRHANYVRTRQERVPTVVKHENYQGPTLGQIINVFKGNVTKYSIQTDIHFARQSRYHDHIVRDEKAYETIKYYIQTNPDKRAEDTHYTKF